MVYGYTGKILHIDLTTGKTEVETPNEQFYRKWLGGNGFIIKYLYDGIKKGTDPLSPEAVSVFASGPLSGTLAHGAGRTHFGVKSPQTGLLADSSAGGGFAAMLKYAGYDAVVIKGKAASPVMIVINNDKVEIRDAERFWGLKTIETQHRIKKELTHEYKVACIGPAGEKLVPMTSIITDTRVAGRSGNGAVWGSKNLKAIAIYGDKDVKVADMGKVKALYGEFAQKAKETLGGLSKYGTTGLPASINAFGGMGTRNMQEETFEHVDKIGGEILNTEHLIRHRSCFSCCIHCAKDFKVNKWDNVSEGPEYETQYSFGSMPAIADVDYVIEADRLSDEYGLDTISAGVTASMIMELMERGLLTEKDTDGRTFKFGNGEDLLELVRIIAERRGEFGDLICKGTRAIAEKLGGDAYKYAFHAKGLEPAGHSPRAQKTMSVGYATSPRGGSHHDARPIEYGLPPEKRKTTEGRALNAFNTQNWTCLGDTLVVCHFAEKIYGTSVAQVHSDWVNAVTGWNTTLDEVKLIAERIYTMERLFTIRESGKARAGDTIPWRALNEPIPSGTSKGMYTTQKELDTMLDEYYDLRGWDRKGVPTKATLKRLGLEEYS